MSDSLMTIIAIFLAAVLMFVFPLMAVAEKNDDIAQTAVATATAEFTMKEATKGKITEADYEEFLTKLNATGNTYVVDIEVQIIDDNIGKKHVVTSSNLIGENAMFSVFTKEILDKLYGTNGNEKGDYLLDKGYIIIVTVKNTNTTMAQTLRSFFYKVTGKGNYQILASASATVVNTGK